MENNPRKIIKPFTIDEEVKNSKEIINPFLFVGRKSMGMGRKGAIIPLTEEKKFKNPVPKDVILPHDFEETEFINAVIEKEEKMIREVANLPQLKNSIIVADEKLMFPISKLANFEVKPVSIIRIFQRNGKEVESNRKIEFRVRFGNEIEEEMEILVSEIDNLCKKIRNKISYALLNPDELNAEKLIVAEFRLKTMGLHEKYVFVDAGWNKIGEKYYYLHDNVKKQVNITFRTGKCMQQYKYWNGINVGKMFFKAFQLSEDKENISVMILFSLTGILYRLFEMVGSPIRFLLFVNGETGAMKTEICKIFFSQLCSEEYFQIPRRIDLDTQVSIINSIVNEGSDTVTFFDDYCPAKTSSQKNHIDDNLEAIIRCVGDGIIKSKSNIQGKDLRGKKVGGVVVVAGEIRGKGRSSILRTLYCTITKGNININILSWFQNNPLAYSTGIYCFTEYIEKNWEIILQFIKSKLDEERNRICRFLEPGRMFRTALILNVVAEIFAKFLVEECGMNIDLIQGDKEFWKNSILKRVNLNNEELQEESIAMVFLQTINILILNKKICIRNLKEKDNSLSVSDGFEDENYYYFFPEIILSKVNIFQKQMGKQSLGELREITENLFAENIIKKYPNGPGKTTFYARILVCGKKQKTLKISKVKFQQIIEEKD